MAFPWLHESTFESGDNTEWDSETDTDSKLSFPHYVELASRRLAPYRGAYSAFIDLSLGTNAAYVQEDGNFDTAAAGTIWVRFYFYARGLTMAASDRFTIFALQSGVGVDEAVVNVRNNAGVIEILASEVSNSATVRATALVQNAWHSVELRVVVDTGGGNDGTIDFYVDGVQVGTQITALDQGAITQARLGAMDLDAGTTSGYLLFNSVIADDAQIFPDPERFPRQRIFTKSGHLFVGPGAIDLAALLTTGASNTCYLYDTDIGNTSAATSRVVELDLNAATSVAGPIWFDRGCYVALAGTNPRGQVIVSGCDNRAMPGPIYYSEDGAIYYGQNRKQRVPNV